MFIMILGGCYYPTQFHLGSTYLPHLASTTVLRGDLTNDGLVNKDEAIQQTRAFNAELSVL